MKTYTKKEFKSLIEIPIHEALREVVDGCMVSIRVTNLFNNIGIRTLGQLITWSAYDLKRFRWDGVYFGHKNGFKYSNSGFGVVSLREVEDKLAKLGFCLRLRKNPYAKTGNEMLSFSNVNCTHDNEPDLDSVWDMYRMSRFIELGGAEGIKKRKVAEIKAEAKKRRAEKHGEVEMTVARKVAEIEASHRMRMDNVESELQRPWVL